MTRRDFSALVGISAAGQTAGAEIVVDPTPRFEISPFLYMQFMEPLGTTDSSVEAAWDYEKDDWRKDFVECTADLKPGMLRWGGNYSRFYKWREAVGPVKLRPPHINWDWGGKETNRAGTHEFVDLCRRVGAEPLYCVNFLGDGHKRFQAVPHEGNRTGDAREAADWVSYCNDPDDKLRISHGRKATYDVKWWQIGNETSYGQGGFPVEQAIRHTVEFAKAIRARDRTVKLIGWGDWNRGRENRLWAPEMVKGAGEHLDLIAIHMMGQRPLRKDTMLWGNRYQTDPARAWEEMLELGGEVERKVGEIEAAVPKHDIAITEGHLSLAPHNANPVLLEWLSAAYHARSMLVYERHAARIKISTLADFCGNRWTVNALLMQVPRGVSYLTPAGCVMRLFGRLRGTRGVDAVCSQPALDVSASRSGERVYLHVLNKDFLSSAEVAVRIKGMRIMGGRILEIAPDNPREYVSNEQPKAFEPKERRLEGDRWRFPARSVSVLEIATA